MWLVPCPGRCTVAPWRTCVLHVQSAPASRCVSGLFCLPFAGCPLQSVCFVMLWVGWPLNIYLPFVRLLPAPQRCHLILCIACGPFFVSFSPAPPCTAFSLLLNSPAQRTVRCVVCVAVVAGGWAGGHHAGHQGPRDPDGTVAWPQHRGPEGGPVPPHLHQLRRACSLPELVSCSPLSLFLPLPLPLPLPPCP